MNSGRMLSAPSSSFSPPSSSPSLPSSQPTSRSLLSRLRPSSASSYWSSLQSVRHSTSTLVLLALAFLLLNLLACLFIVSSVEREQHSPSSHPRLPVSHSTPSEPLQACEVSNPLRPCVTAALLAANTDASIQSQLTQALDSIANLRAAVLASPSTPTDSGAVAAAVGDAAPLPLSSAHSSLEPYLIIGLPSVARSSPVARHYLNHTLQSIRRQLPSEPHHPMYGRVHVYVMNNQADGRHDMWEALRDEMRGDSNFHFLVNPGALQDATPDLRDPGSANEPGWRIRKQTRDVVATMEAAKRKSRYYMFMEDDFTFCPSLMRLIPYLVNKAHILHPHWFSLKFSFGMNGYIVHNGDDMDHLSAYLIRKQRLRPPDHLIIEWSAGEKESAAYKKDRPNIVYRYNMLHHLGTVSSLRDETQGDYPPCWHEMNTQVVFEVESFRLSECGHTDIWPCWTPERIEQAREGREREEESSWPEVFNIPSQWIADAQEK